MRFGPWEIAAVIAVFLLLFGARKIPEIMKGFGIGIKEFKKGLSEDQSEDSKDKETPDGNSKPKE